MIYKINYLINEKSLFAIGKLEKDDKDFFYIRGTRNNKVYMIRKENVVSMIEIGDD